MTGLFDDPLARLALEECWQADWLLEKIAPDWHPFVDAFLHSATGLQLRQWLEGRFSAGATIFPPQPFRALELTALNATRVVVLGQDPYHGAGQAQGLAFSVAPHIKLPPSLRNIFKERQRDLGLSPPPHGCLRVWAEQGVLLLNTCLTVEEGLPASHAGRGWEALTDSLIQACALQQRPIVFMLWGAQAQSKRNIIAPCNADGRHLVLSANHPSPLSALREPKPFIGCGHFSQARQWLARHDADAHTLFA